ASPGAYCTSPIWSRRMNGSATALSSPGNGRRTGNPSPSNVRIESMTRSTPRKRAEPPCGIPTAGRASGSVTVIAGMAPPGGACCVRNDHNEMTGRRIPPTMVGEIGGHVMEQDPVKGKTIRWAYDDGPVKGQTFEHTFSADGKVSYREANAKPGAAGEE